jgi:hypothetical protein
MFFEYYAIRNEVFMAIHQPIAIFILCMMPCQRKTVKFRPNPGLKLMDQIREILTISPLRLSYRTGILPVDITFHLFLWGERRIPTPWEQKNKATVVETVALASKKEVFLSLLKTYRVGTFSSTLHPAPQPNP